MEVLQRELLEKFQVDERELDGELLSLARQGISYHHAGLLPLHKELVERLFTSGLLKLLFTTETFALGINMPARTVVLDALQKYDGRGTRPLTVREFMQKAGRAGRRGMDSVGYVVVRMDFEQFGEAKPGLARYLADEPEKVNSSFNLSFNSIVNLLDRLDDVQIRAVVERSFLAWRLQRQAEGLGERADKLEANLKERGWEKGARGAAPGMKRKAKEDELADEELPDLEEVKEEEVKEEEVKEEEVKEEEE